MTPAGRANRKDGSALAVWISATISGDGLSETISQAAATPCIQIVRFIATLAHQRRRKVRSLSAAHILSGRDIQSPVICRNLPLAMRADLLWRAACVITLKIIYCQLRFNRQGQH